RLASRPDDRAARRVGIAARHSSLCGVPLGSLASGSRSSPRPAGSARKGSARAGVAAGPPATADSLDAGRAVPLLLVGRSRASSLCSWPVSQRRRLSSVLQQPQTIGPYKILEVLGEGGMGV